MGMATGTATEWVRIIQPTMDIDATHLTVRQLAPNAGDLVFESIARQLLPGNKR
jgi:hypothetical protein